MKNYNIIELYLISIPGIFAPKISTPNIFTFYKQVTFHLLDLK